MQRSISTVSVSYLKDSDMDSEMCNMFGSLSLKGWGAESQKIADTQALHAQSQAIALPRTSSASGSDSSDSVMMEMVDGEGNIQFVSASVPKVEEPELLGCGILNALQRHYCPHSAQAACSPSDPDFNFLDTILTHREAFVAWPYGHRSCSKALTQLAFELERRHQEENKDGDLDTAIALHNEAWLMSGWYST